MVKKESNPRTKAFSIFVVMLLMICSGFSQTRVLSFHNDSMMTGQNLTETILTPVNVNATSFGKLFTVATDGKIEGQPLYVPGLLINGSMHDVFFVASEHDTVYAFDAQHGGSPLWHTSTLGAGESPTPGDSCGQVAPVIGITATPVIDLNAGPHGTIYVVAMSNGRGAIHQRIHALDITTGAEEFGGPKSITASFPGTGDNSSGGFVHFNPARYKDRTSLAIVNGVVYTTWASHCDIRPYTGWLIGYDETTLNQSVVFNFTPNGNDGSMWGGGAGPAVDTGGNMYFQLANGTFDTTLNAQGFPSKGDFGNGFVKLSVTGSTPTVLDYWTMHNTVSESASDTDLGSGGTILLPDVTDSSGNVHHLGVGAGKDRHLYVYDRDNMGHFNPNNNSTLYQDLGVVFAGQHFGSPVWFNNRVYFGAISDHVKAFTMSNARLSAAPTASTPNTFAYPGPTLSLSANGTANAILWAVSYSTSSGTLFAYDATNIANQLYSSAQAANGRDQLGATVKRAPPTIADGKVFVPMTTGVAVFGVIGQTTTPPPAPTGLVANLSCGPQLNLAWNASTGATNYNVKRSLTSGGPYSLVASGVTTTFFNDKSAMLGTTYFYVISASNSAGESGNSNEATVTVVLIPCPVISINAGGPAVIPFAADTDFVGGTTINHANTINLTGVTNPAPMQVYQTARIGNFTYTIPGFATGSSHTVRLHFAETFWTAAGKRRFNVSINGTQVLTNFDIFAAAGAMNKATIQQFTVNANTVGQYVIQFTSVLDKSLISGIEIQ